MGDMHQIRFYQSTWADTQRLMHRWGMGHSDDTSSASDCLYVIEIGGPTFGLNGRSNVFRPMRA